MTTDHEVEYGAHLPLIGLGTPPSLATLAAYVRTAARLGYRHLCANDHLLFGRPWLDGPTALAALIEASRDMTWSPRPVSCPWTADLSRELGSPAGLRRVARLGDGWLASAYNTTPDSFRDGLDRLGEELRRRWSTLDLGSEERRVGEPGLRFRRADPAKDVTRASSPSRPTIP